MNSEGNSDLLGSDDSTVALDALPELVIRPSKGWVSLNPGDLWRYRKINFILFFRV